MEHVIQTKSSAKVVQKKGTFFAPAFVQPKLSIGAANDSYELEADAVADKVMRMTDNGTVPLKPSPLTIQRKCAACKEEENELQRKEADEDENILQKKPIANNTIQKKCAACEEEEKNIHRKESNATSTREATPSVHQVLQSHGQKLDHSTRSFMEERFGYDFGNVQIHKDSLADQSSSEINALAYTHGNHIVFGTGQYQPNTNTGKQLLAHELTHVVQQGSATKNLSVQDFVQRACLPESECATVIQSGGSATAFATTMQQQAEPERQRILRESPQVAAQKPHGHIAKNIEEIFGKRLPEMRKMIHHIFVDETIPEEASAYHTDNCALWAEQHLPEGANKTDFQGATHGCIFVPQKLEDQAAMYNSNYKTNPKFKEDKSVEDALQFFVLRILAHETTHGKFNEATISYPVDQKCTKETIGKELSELAACISEFPFINNLNNPKDMRQPWIDSKLKTRRDPANPNESISESIHDIRCSCACTDADKLIKEIFEFVSSGWSKAEIRAFHVLMNSDEITKLRVYWPYEVPPIIGQAGRHELSVGVGATSSSGSINTVALTYRYVLSQWAAGKLRLAGGLQFDARKELDKSEFGGAGLLSLEYIQSPETKNRVSPGFIGRVDTGVGVGEFLLKPSGDVTGETTKGDLILQVSGGVHFFIPNGTSKVPASVEVAYRLAQPLDSGAERVQSLSLNVGISFGGK